MGQKADVELYVDGGARGNPGPAACAFVIKGSERGVIQAQGFYLGRTTNNVAEYTGLIRGLQAVQALGLKEIQIYSDSELMVKQLIGEYRVRNSDLQGLYEQVQRLLLAFDRWQIKHVRREFNSEADRLVNETLDKGGNGARSPEPSNSQTLFDQAQTKVQAEPAVPSEPAEGQVKVMVEIVVGPAESKCPACMQKGQCFVFTDFVPAGVCIHAAQSLLPTVIAMQRDASFRGRSMMVKCSHPGCGASFKLSLV